MLQTKRQRHGDARSSSVTGSPGAYEHAARHVAQKEAASIQELKYKDSVQVCKLARETALNRKMRARNTLG